MILLPAIDLIGGQAVRLVRGDYGKKTVYANDPLSVASGFQTAGAGYLHMVDLDGAKSGSPENFDTVRRITEGTSLFVELGGGIRTEDRICSYLELGVRRVILGTAAVRDFSFLTEMVKKYGDAIAVGVDLKKGKVAVDGWLSVTELDGRDFLTRLADIGVKNVIVTDIAKDGAMMGTNLEMYEQLSDIGLKLTASGGVSSVEEIRKLSRLGLYGAILGKAIYTGAVNLADALDAAKETQC